MPPFLQLFCALRCWSGVWEGATLGLVSASGTSKAGSLRKELPNPNPQGRSLVAENCWLSLQIYLGDTATEEYA